MIDTSIAVDSSRISSVGASISVAISALTLAELAGRKPRGSRAIDLMIAATALAHDLPLYTLNAKDLRGLEALIEIVDVGSPAGA